MGIYYVKFHGVLCGVFAHVLYYLPGRQNKRGILNTYSERGESNSPLPVAF